MGKIDPFHLNYSHVWQRNSLAVFDIGRHNGAFSLRQQQAKKTCSEGEESKQQHRQK